MNLSTLPSRGVFVPTHLIFHDDLPPATLRTWMQLRCLAWSGWSTPPMTAAQIASHLGIHTNRLYRHLAQLKDHATLSWQILSQGMITISFPQELNSWRVNNGDNPNLEGTESPQALHHEISIPAHYFPPKILGYLSYDDEDDENDGSMYLRQNSDAVAHVANQQPADIPQYMRSATEQHAFLP